jgi:hypothetical protein
MNNAKQLLYKMFFYQQILSNVKKTGNREKHIYFFNQTCVKLLLKINIKFI